MNPLWHKKERHCGKEEVTNKSLFIIYISNIKTYHCGSETCQISKCTGKRVKYVTDEGLPFKQGPQGPLESNKDRRRGLANLLGITACFKWKMNKQTKI